MQLYKVKDKGKYSVIKMDESKLSIMRLMDMGLLPGETIKIKHEALLGDPISIEFRDSHVSIRLKDAAYIDVSPLEKSGNK
tara:strand:+ start:1464 stop:1706 length:243 start_codon:yes stop_codon:yes gene_type:complete